MSVDFLYFEWWIDTETNKPWVRHFCLDSEVDEYRAPPPWRVVDTPDGQALTPSFDCAKCGRHVVLGPADRVGAPSPAGLVARLESPKTQ